MAEDILEFTNEEWFEKTNGEELSIYPKELNVYKSKFEGIDITKLRVISEPSFGSTKIYNDPSSWDFPYYISYYPNDDFDGEDSFEYEICKDDECYNGTITIRVEDFDKSTIHLSPDSFNYGYNEFNRNHTQIIMGEITATLSYEFSDFVSQDELGGLSFNDIELEVQQPSNGEVTVDSEGTINFVGEYSYEDARENGYEVTIEYSIKYEGKVYNSSIIVTVQREDWGSGW
ncbi:hypothetical protein C9994_05270 [Marivirga lumbricoides]|uniref:Uncharacterized protein n=1 Tax=Marivirga lumbricoides TaxID=1046115 RepID=A0A2T4DT03_9BACT|nr:hypothetical protein C9994_05270 [Marivirga lumbricoides]